MSIAYDVIVVGAGITGCGIARELSRYRLRILVLDKEEDICCGVSKGNSSMVHSGYDPEPGTLKACLNVRGARLYPQWARDLGFKFLATGSMMAALHPEEVPRLRKYLRQGIANGVPGIAILSGREARMKQPYLHPQVLAALWCPTAGYVDSQQVVLALAENAVQNGVDFLVNREVTDVRADRGRIQGVVTNGGEFRAPYVINAAGLYADDIAAMAGPREFTITPRRGSVLVFDRRESWQHPDVAVYAVPGEGALTKGGCPLVSPEYNPLWGPSSREADSREDRAVSSGDLQAVLDRGLQFVPHFPASSIINYFSGCRPAADHEDFHVAHSRHVHGLIHAAGIQSPGVASSPAIAEMVVGLLQEWESLEEKPHFQSLRQAPPRFREASREEQAALIAADPAYGHVICRCEHVTEAEVLRAIRGPIPARNLDAVKRRTRAGTGRCQGGFCGPRVVEILGRESGVPAAEITKKGPGSEMFGGQVGELLRR